MRRANAPVEFRSAATFASVKLVRSDTNTPTRPLGISPQPMSARPASAERGTKPRLAMQPLSFWINEAGRTNLNLDAAIAHRIDRDDALAETRASAREQAESNPAAERRRKSDRGYYPSIICGFSRSLGGDQMCASVKAIGPPCWRKAHQRLPLRRQQARTLGHDPAHIVLILRHHPAETKIGRRGAAVEFVAGDVALFDAHYAERFRAVGRDAERCARLHQRLRHCVAEARRHCDLIGKFARERQPEQARRNAAADGKLGHR